MSFFAVMIIPDHARQGFLDNLIGGLSMYLAGPILARMLFHGFVVLVGTLILAGAVNTAIIGSNGVLNRVAEDGVLPDWFRHPHKKFGTTSRLVNLIVGLQLITILISRGDVYMLGEAYAFGVVWSFAMKALSVLVLRFKKPGRARLAGTAQFPHRQNGDSAGPDDDYGGALLPGDHQRGHQEGRDDFGSYLYHRVLHHFRTLRHCQPETQGGPRPRDGEIPAGRARSGVV
ncbi:MAG: APC family permease [Ignavibacteriota bacterium]